MKPESQDQGWADFEHTTQSNPVGAQELLERYSEFKRFIAELPRKELVERRWLATTDDLSPLATIFFDLPHASQPTLFRKSAKSDEKILGVWLSRARSEAEYIAITQDLPAFTKLTQGELREVALRSVDPQAARLLPTIIAKLGIILVYVRALPGMKADGAVFHLSTGHPVIAMSLRFPRLDYFWFTLLHELSHLVLTSRLMRAINTKKLPTASPKIRLCIVSLGAIVRQNMILAIMPCTHTLPSRGFIQVLSQVFSGKSPETTSAIAR